MIDDVSLPIQKRIVCRQKRQSKDYPKKIRDRPLRFYISLNQAEYDFIASEARKAGVFRAAYVRAMTFEGQLIPRLTDEEKVLFREMVNISQNLSELIKIAREQGLPQTLPMFEKYRNAVDALLEKIKL